MKKLITLLFALVWLVNGLICKVLNLVPRHQEIVASILGDNNSRTITILIGLTEILMAMWIISGFKARLNALAQVFVVIVMNILEFILAPELLLWGRYNAFFAALFVCFILFNEFYLKKKLNVVS